MSAHGYIIGADGGGSKTAMLLAHTDGSEVARLTAGASNPTDLGIENSASFLTETAARLCAEKGTPCFVSLEKKMACGIGACLGCTCETKSGEGKSVCKNGPVFDATEVFF